jgi:toxin-antitoxin system PIN domain toxin
VRWLLDVNVLIALIDPAHIGHHAAHHWFAKSGSTAWATCPITENGVLRIVGHPSYPNSAGSPAQVASVVTQFRHMPGHVFWPDELSLIDSGLIDLTQVRTHGQVTDTYLLALAATRGGKLATFDRRLNTRAVRGGQAALHVIDGAGDHPLN